MRHILRGGSCGAVGIAVATDNSGLNLFIGNFIVDCVQKMKMTKVVWIFLLKKLLCISPSVVRPSLRLFLRTSDSFNLLVFSIFLCLANHLCDDNS